MIKIGLGQDSHQFSTDNRKKLILGGIHIENAAGLEGNSDGDVILHSLCNAISSAFGGDSLGTWSDDMCKNKGISESSEYVAVIFNKIRDKGYSVGNIAVCLEMKKPRIMLAVIHRMKARIASLVLTDVSCVGITITSGESLSAFGEGRGIQAITNVLLYDDKK